MKKALTLTSAFPIAIGMLLLTTFAATAQTTTFSGRILAPTGDSVFLQNSYVVDNKWVTDKIAAAKLKPDGSFEMKFKMSEGKKLTFFDGNEVTTVFLMPGDDISLNLHTAYFDETLLYSGRGAERNNTIAAISLASEMNWNPVYTEMENPDTAKLFPQIDSFTEKITGMMADYAKTFPEMDEYLTTRIADEKKNANDQKSYMRESVLFKNLTVSMVGKQIIDIAGTGLQDEKVSLSQFRGKTTVIDFWATWCGPCKAEIPHFAKLEEQYGKDINFVSISVWDDLEKWKKMATDLKQTHTMFISKEAIDQIKPYMVNSIPRYMVIDKDQKIISIDAPRPSSNKMQDLF